MWNDSNFLVVVKMCFDADNDTDVTTVGDVVSYVHFFDVAVGSSHIMLLPKIEPGAHNPGTFAECKESLTYIPIPK